MRKLNTIQRRGSLNIVLYEKIDQEDGGAAHMYTVKRWDAHPDDERFLLRVRFQTGPRGEEGSTDGVVDADLLEMVRDRLTRFQDGAFACRENEHALRHVEEALLWLAKRAEDRFYRKRAAANAEEKHDHDEV